MEQTREQCTFEESGERCREWAVADRDRCIRHGGLRLGPDGAAVTPDELVYALAVMLIEKQAQYIAALDGIELPPDRAVRLFSVLSQNAARVGKLLRDYRALTGESADGLIGAVSKALDELSSELAPEL
jgi:hypothetical protein